MYQATLTGLKKPGSINFLTTPNLGISILKAQLFSTNHINFALHSPYVELKYSTYFITILILTIGRGV